MHIYIYIYYCMDMCVYYLRGEIGTESCAPLKAVVIYELEEEIEKNVERKKKKKKTYLILHFIFLACNYLNI